MPHRFRLGIAALLVSLLHWGFAPGAFAQAAPSLRTFFANDDISEVKLSPSGRFMALTVANQSGRTVLAVVELASEAPPKVVAAAPDADIRSFDWVNDDRLVYNIVDLQSEGANQTFGPGLFSVKRDGSEARQLMRVFRNATELTMISTGVLGPDHRLLYVPGNGGNDVIVGQYMFNRESDLVSVVPKRLDVTTGRSRLAVIGYPNGALGWAFDRAGEARAVRTGVGDTAEVFWRDAGKDTWRSLVKSPRLSLPWYPLAVDGAGRLYVTAKAADSTSVLKRFDFATGAPEPAPLASAPGFDLYRGLIFDDTGDRRLVGVRVETDAETTTWFDPERRKLQALADARFPGRINHTTCEGCAKDGAMLVRSYSDQDPGTFSTYQPATEKWTTIGRARRAVEPQQMAVLDFHRTKARDGLDLPIWVTTPRGKPASPRPAVVLVHGGPWVRGTHWGWSADAQFLASRGYVVIEPEFRGSDGFGEKHMRAGDKKWGTTMQDDVADAVRWAMDKGLIDGKRVCIAGASYGGYATLMGAIRHPDLYRCGVAWVAVSDPRIMFEASWISDISRVGREYFYPELIGDLVKDADLLKAASPLERAREIRIPMLMAFGADDRRVPVEHGTRMRAALRDAGNEPEYVVYGGEGHGWLKVENRIDFWTRVEKFFAKHLN